MAFRLTIGHALGHRWHAAQPWGGGKVLLFCFLRVVELVLDEDEGRGIRDDR